LARGVGGGGGVRVEPPLPLQRAQLLELLGLLEVAHEEVVGSVLVLGHLDDADDDDDDATNTHVGEEKVEALSVVLTGAIAEQKRLSLSS
jgi:hypothetical protein